MAVPVDRGVTLAGVTLGLRRLAWLIEVRGLANRSEGFGGWALSIKVRDLGGPLVGMVSTSRVGLWWPRLAISMLLPRESEQARTVRFESEPSEIRTLELRVVFRTASTGWSTPPQTPP